MSLEALEAFRKKMRVDARLLEELRNANAAAMVRVASAAGFMFTVEEARAAIDDASAEVTDEQLEAIAGGLIGVPTASIKDLSSQRRSHGPTSSDS
jgi:predicted ribosomally synthesized peptide with nif11-like leader